MAFSAFLNSILATCATQGVNSAACPYDAISIDLELAGLNNGYEQLFILTTEQLEQFPVPNPGSLMLLGASLALTGVSAWRRRR